MEIHWLVGMVMVLLLLLLLLLMLLAQLLLVLHLLLVVDRRRHGSRLIRHYSCGRSCQWGRRELTITQDQSEEGLRV